MVTNLNFSVLMCSGPDEELGSVALQHEFIVGDMKLSTNFSLPLDSMRIVIAWYRSDMQNLRRMTFPFVLQAFIRFFSFLLYSAFCSS
jgi:hypothetical protein